MFTPGSASIRALLFAIIAIVALPCAGIIIYSGMQLRHETLNEAVQLTQDLADRIASEQQNVVSGAEQFLASLAQIPEIKTQDIGKTQPMLATFLEMNPQYANLLITDRDGNVLCSAIPLKSSFSVADRRNFKNALKTGHFSSGEFVFSRSTNKPTINYASPYMNNHGDLAGVIIVVFDLEHYKNILDRVNIPRKSGILLVDHAGTIIFSSFDSGPKAGVSLRTDLYRQMFNGPEKFSGFINSMHEDKRILSYRKLRLKGEATPYMYVRVGIPYDEALSTANKKFIENVALLSSFLFAAIIVATITSKKLITNRINLLTDATKSFAAGSRDIRIGDRIKGGELATLGSAIDNMVKQILLQEQALRKNEERLHLATKAANIGTWDWNIVKNELLWDENMYAIYGIHEDEFSGSLEAWSQTLHPEELRKAETEMRAALLGERDYSSEFRIIRPDGEVRFIQAASRTFFDGSGRAVRMVGTNHDTTERRQIERELRKSEIRFRSFVENANDVVFALTTEGVFTYVSPNWKDVFGYELEDTIGKPFVPFVHPDDVANCFAFLQLVMSTGEKQRDVEYRVLHKDGTWIWYSANGSCIRETESEEASFLGIGRDITDRKRAEEERLENLLFIEALMKYSPMGIRVFDGETGKCILLNQAAADIARGEMEIMQEQHFRALESWRESGLLEVAESVLADGGARMVETDMHTSFGRHVIVTYYLSKLVIKEKPHLLIIGRDVTEEKRIADENRKIETQMLHVQKLESLGVMAGGIAHDFNNILTAILGNAELALRHSTPDSGAHEYLQNIEISAQRAADLARQMLAYSGKGFFVIKQLDVNTIITEMSRMLDVSISKRVSMRFNLAPELPAVRVDTNQISQVIMNLMINASEAIGDQNGVITITTGAQMCEEAYLSELWLNDKLEGGLYVYCEIADTGCGMDQNTMDKIFDPFFTTKFTGRGLGMAAVLGIVRGHKGAISIWSEQGKGSSFKVFLPTISECRQAL